MIGRAVRGRRVVVLIAGLLVLASAPAARGADRVYWANGGNNSISYANLDGSGGGQLDITGATASGPRGVAIDLGAGRIYWANQTSGTISYANLDGSGGGGQLNITGATPDNPRGMTIDPAAGRIYWSNRNDTISYANLDGTGGGGQFNTTGVITDGPYGLAIDPEAGRLFWANLSIDKIAYANLDGTGGGTDLDISGTTPEEPHGIAIDRAGGKVYWTNFFPDTSTTTISFANLDGTGGGGELSLAGSTPSGGVGIAIDHEANKLYYGNLGNDTISYVNLDGTGGGGELNIAGATSKDSRFLALVRSPSGVGVPQVAGGSSPGSVLTCSQGAWAPDQLGAFFHRAPQSLAYQWTRNGAEIAGATDSSYTAFIEGDYRCRVTATNVAGSTSQTSAPHAVPDSAAPSAAITDGPDDKTKKRKATFEFTGSDGTAFGSFRCSLDGAQFVECGSPYTVKVKKGEHTFQVVAIDQAGNVSSPASDEWKVRKKR